MQLTDGTMGTAAAPSGASTGKFEAIELRDGDQRRYGGKGVLKAVRSVSEIISPALEKVPSLTVREIDHVLCKLDGTPNKAHLGANATLAVSMAAARAIAAHYRMPLYRFLGGAVAYQLPRPMMNILNGGAHAGNNIDIQEFMIVPTGAPNFREGLRWCAEITHTLGQQLKARGLSTGVGDEGGFAPDLESDEAAIEAVLEAVEKAGYGGKVQLALDAAGSEWAQENDRYRLPKRGKELATEDMIEYWENLVQKYPILSIEDPLGEEDWQGWAEMTRRLGDRVQLVGDDLFVTNMRAPAPGHGRGGGQRHPHQAQPDWHPHRNPGLHRAGQAAAATRPSSPTARGRRRTPSSRTWWWRSTPGRSRQGRPAAPSGWPSTTACCASRSAVDRTGESW